jgi:ketosteroid isomerase-like protein
MSDANERFAALLGRMTAAICAGDAEAAAACFTPEGAYHDQFYGEFKGRREIARMVREFFHRDAGDFSWTVYDAVSDGRTGYARYDFAYASKMAGSEGRRVGFTGICCCKIEGGLLRSYEEIFERAPVLAKLGFPDERLLRSVKRWSTD